MLQSLRKQLADWPSTSALNNFDDILLFRARWLYTFVILLSLVSVCVFDFATKLVRDYSVCNTTRRLLDQSQVFRWFPEQLRSCSREQMVLLGPVLVSFADELLEMSSVLKQILELCSERAFRSVRAVNVDLPTRLTKPWNASICAASFFSLLSAHPSFSWPWQIAEPILNWALQQTHTSEHDGFGSYLVRCRRQALLDRIARLRRPIAKPTCGLGVESLDGLTLSTNLRSSLGLVSTPAPRTKFLASVAPEWP